VPGSKQQADHYKWVVLSNTTLGVLMATIDMSIMLIALPDIGKYHYREEAEPVPVQSTKAA
jgi:hypothetical protein